MDFDDLLNIGEDLSNIPSNGNPRDAAVQCITDLVDCCGAPHTEHGNWYYPNRSRVYSVEVDRYGSAFLVNRDPNDVINGQQVNGSVRLFRRFSAIPERGRFCCELPSAANPSVNQPLCINICESVTCMTIVLCFNYFHSEFWDPLLS